MPKSAIDAFQEDREKLNQLVMRYAGRGTKRFYSLDSQAYREGALSVKVKEMLGLLMVGGTITIPHQRRALQAWDELKRHSVHGIRRTAKDS
jgi:shikimate 5-dehydrogenase